MLPIAVALAANYKQNQLHKQATRRTCVGATTSTHQLTPRRGGAYHCIPLFAERMPCACDCRTVSWFARGALVWVVQRLGRAWKGPRVGFPAGDLEPKPAETSRASAGGANAKWGAHVSKAATAPANKGEL